uniref:Killer cell lectin like receptor G2 n=1 Tax=Sciurus vulgaris TaxID=55149 RepID=A0A8D2CY98_SCIVU
MEWTQEASGGGQAEADIPKELSGSQIPGLDQPQVPVEAQQAERPESSPRPTRAVKEAAGAGQDLPDGRKLPPPRPGPLRVPPLSLGYGAFRRLGSASREPPSPGPSSAEQPPDGEAAGPELLPWSAPGEQTPGTWAPMELQVDVRVKSVGAATGSRAPSPAPSTRFLTVPVPESPAFSRRSCTLQRASSPGGTLGRCSPLAAAQTERDHHVEGQDNAAGGRSGSPGSPGSPTCRCRCQERGLEREDAALLQRAGIDGKKLPRAITLIGLPMYMKSLRWALAVMAVLLAGSTVAIVALASRAGARCRPCPQGWMWSEEHCYYLSSEAQDWEASRAFCLAHHATLPLLSHTQDFLSRHLVNRRSWVGARRDPQGWHWIDGAPLAPEP